jgi:hypothetical protein
MEWLIKKDYIYIDLRKYLYVNIANPKKTMNKLKGVFKPLKYYFKFTKDIYAPTPVLWVSRPAYVQIMFKDVGWKDKDDIPRFEYNPYIWIHIYKWNFVWYWSLPLHQNHRDDEYWEQALWYLYYCKTISQGIGNKLDIEKAKESWPWQDMKGNSTWTDEFLVK